MTYVLHFTMNVFKSQNCSSNSSMTPAGSDIGEYYQILQIQSSAPDDGRKHRPKHVEVTRNNNLYSCISLVVFIIISQCTDSWASITLVSSLLLPLSVNCGVYVLLQPRMFRTTLVSSLLMNINRSLYFNVASVTIRKHFPYLVHPCVLHH